ncbi:MAG: succinylglutamate desuccinylase/aspartoacylase family protein [Natronomonas sp.]
MSGSSSVSLGDATAEPGEITVGRLPVGEARDGSTVALPVCVVNGANEGKTLYVQAVSDGNELNGLGVIRRLVPRLDPEAISGQLLIVGIVNYYGFLVAEHRNPIDDTKINRTYPGNTEGTASERIAAATFEAATRADLALDLHQGSTSCMINEARVRCGHRHRLHRDCLELAKTFGCGHILDQKGPSGQLARAATDEGVPTIDPELGGSVGFDEQSIRTGVRGIFNVLYHYDFLRGAVERSEQTRATGFEQYGSPAGGLVSFEVELGDRVSRGDVLFEITDPFGQQKQQVESNTDGIFWRHRRLPQVASGEYVCSVGTSIDQY